MPPKHRSQGEGTLKGNVPKTRTRTQATDRQTTRAAIPRNRNNQPTVPPQAHSRTRHQFTDAEMTQAFGGLDLHMQPATDAIRGLDMRPQPTGTTTSMGHAVNRASNPGGILQLQAQVQHLDLELGTLREQQDNLGTRIAASLPTPTQGCQPHMLQQMIPEPMVGTSPQDDCNAILERSLPITPAPSEVPTATLMVPDPIPKGVDAIPAFNNRTEDFKMWILRLEAVTSQYRWNDDQKRGVILSNLQEEPATFIYKTLTNRERQDYGLLVKALTGQFTELESQKVYRLKYRNLRQQPGESEQQLATQTKAIYDRACPGRDEKVRQEDLVNAFLEALQDDDQRRALEYPRVPDTIEEVTMQAAHYREAARRPTYADDGFGYGYGLY